MEEKRVIPQHSSDAQPPSSLFPTQPPSDAQPPSSLFPTSIPAPRRLHSATAPSSVSLPPPCDPAPADPLGPLLPAKENPLPPRACLATLNLKKTSPESGFNRPAPQNTKTVPSSSAASSSRTPGARPRTVASQKVDVKFCPECCNLLYPKQDLKKLVLACRMCTYKEETLNKCVYTSIVDRAKNAKVNAINWEMATDPSLPRTADHPCPRCGGSQVVFCQDPFGEPSDKPFRLYYLCKNHTCKCRWTEDAVI